MLSENTKINTASKLEEKKRVAALQELDPPKTLRLKFCKIGTLQYISHLDLQRTFNRIINRACLPVWYTKGFNPHIKLVFSTPLSVGTQSMCEYLDIRIDREMSCEEIKSRLNAEMTDEFYIIEVYPPKSDFSEISWATYGICITTSGANAALAGQIEKILTTAPLMLKKKTKSGEKEIDITSLIHSIKAYFEEESGKIKICATVSTSSTDYLNPEMLITALKDKLGILSGNPKEEYYSIMRTALLREDMSDFS